MAFDLDGVVIPSEPSFAMFEADHGITRQQFSDFFSGAYRAAMLGAADLETVLGPTLEAWNWDRGLASFVTTWFESCEEPEAKAIRLIRSLRERGIVTVRERLRLPGESILFLDDKLENVAGARAAGWQAAHVPRPADLASTLGRHFDGLAA